MGNAQNIVFYVNGNSAFGKYSFITVQGNDKFSSRIRNKSKRHNIYSFKRKRPSLNGKFVFVDKIKNRRTFITEHFSVDLMVYSFGCSIQITNQNLVIALRIISFQVQPKTADFFFIVFEK